MNLRHALVIILTLAFALSGCGNGFSATVLPTLTRTKSSIAATQTSVTSQPIATSTLAVTNTPEPTATLAPAETLAPCTGNDADFVADVTIPDGTAIKPGAQFTKTWQLRNTGRCTWGAGYRLAYFDGPQMTIQDFMELTQEVKPNQTADISVVFTAPRETGMVKDRWQMQAPDGTRFGKRVFVVIYAGTSPVDSIIGVWQGSYTGGADGGNGNQQVSGEQEIEIRAACRNGQPCMLVKGMDGAVAVEYPFDPQESNRNKESCFSDGFQGYCFSLQKDGALKFSAGGPGYGISGVLRKVAD
jgi:uncharacterized cupredoxin-like copper-binding protein